MKKNLCIYHGNCADGFGAAWVMYQWGLRHGIEIEFYPGVYQKAPPDVTGRDVFLVDFSYKRPVLLEMAAVANTITIIDHHKSAMEDLVDLPANVAAKFDMNHSGAMLTWQHCFGEAQPPALLKHIEDRDLWKFKLKGTREIQAALFSYPYDFNVWDGLMQTHVRFLEMDGVAIERKHHKDIKELLEVTMREDFVGGVSVPVANLPYTLASDAAHYMAKHYAPKTFAACYYVDKEGNHVYSLRSIEGGTDVSEIAKMHGGGGHKHAAGFKRYANTYYE